MSKGVNKIKTLKKSNDDLNDHNSENLNIQKNDFHIMDYNKSSKTDNDFDKKEVLIQFETNVSGWLYCLSNELYNFYGEDVFKIEKSKDVNKSLRNYTSYYIEPCIVMFKIIVRNMDLAERILFYKLEQYRINPQKEFFKCNINIIKNEMIEVAKFIENNSDEEIIKTYVKLSKID